MKTALKITGISLAALVLFGGAMFAAAEALEETEAHNETISGSVDHVVIKAETGDIEVVPAGAPSRVERTDRYAGRLARRQPDARERRPARSTANASGVLSPFCTADYRSRCPTA